MRFFKYCLLSSAFLLTPEFVFAAASVEVVEPQQNPFAARNNVELLEQAKTDESARSEFFRRVALGNVPVPFRDKNKALLIGFLKGVTAESMTDDQMYAMSRLMSDLKLPKNFWDVVEEKARNDSPSAISCMAWHASQENGGNKKAFSRYKEALDYGKDVMALINLSRFEEAAAQGSAYAMTKLAINASTPADIINHLRKAADLHYSPAQYCLGKLDEYVLERFDFFFDFDSSPKEPQKKNYLGLTQEEFTALDLITPEEIKAYMAQAVAQGETSEPTEYYQLKSSIDFTRDMIAGQESLKKAIFSMQKISQIPIVFEDSDSEKSDSTSSEEQEESSKNDY